jgi:non-specific serine/threonine protein kinase/serine/threonine-protein kinase
MAAAPDKGKRIPVKPERLAQVEDLFHRALECGTEERIAILEEAGSTDPELRREVEERLSSYEGAGAHVQDVVAGNARSVQESRASASVTPTMNAAETSPETIGRYHLLQLIGEGGMGEVWLAEQKEPVRRCVAVKLIKAGMNTREVIARFEAERQALALMDHPSIAKVFDAGSTPQGAPYFAMEYVAGVPITTYCDTHKLGIRERLELFIHVCEGVQHAHQKAIIHRDLKPSNILVTEVDGKAAPKIIDFGVAKALSQKLTATTMFTRVGALVGTPEYMSPEQALSSGEDIDTRSDVYSLGIVFYELLAGSPPIELRKNRV